VYTRPGAKRLGGRPVGGVESPYLLTGFAVCALCGGGMVVGSRDMKRYRKPIYICAYHRERGCTVCPNGLVAPMDVANEAVRYAIMRDVLSIDILEVALEEALTTLKEPTDGRQSERRALQAELELVEVELARYAEAVAKVGPVDALLAEISRRQQRRRQIQEAIQALSSERHIASLDVTRIWRDLARKLTDWQGLLARQAPEARGILRELLVGKLVFTPREDARGRYYEFTGQGTLSELLAGVICTDGLVTPAGNDRIWTPEFQGVVETR
jgi:hypothetical protein